MKVVCLFLLINLNLAQAFDSGLCDDIVNFSTGSVVRGLDKISDYFSSDVKKECNQDLSLKDQLIASIEEEDLVKFNKILDKLESTPLLKLLGKIKSGNTTELKKFRKFATEKFLILTQRLSENEKKTMKQEPIKTFFVFFQYNNALNYIRDNDRELYKEINTPFGKADAVRHMFINASASRFGMGSFVRKLSTQRELSGGYITYNEKNWKTFQEKDFNRFHEYSFIDLVKCNPSALYPGYFVNATVTISGNRITVVDRLDNNSDCSSVYFEHIEEYTFKKAEYTDSSEQFINIDLVTTGVKATFFDSFYITQNYCGMTDWALGVEKNITGLSCPNYLSFDSFHSSQRSVGDVDYLQISFTGTSINFPWASTESGDSANDRVTSGAITLTKQ